jgi:myo-inositol 2-dehydrogenase/D-chiro-inositol 1-dehydrogenase
VSAKKRSKNPIGLALIGCGKIGRIRAGFAADYPGVEWLGLCDIDEKTGKKLAEDVEADFFTTDIEELLDRPEVNAALIATHSTMHYDPVRAVAERGLPFLVEKPMATGAKESAELLDIIEKNGSDAVLGYTQRFRRRFLVAKEKLGAGEVGDVTTVVSRAFLNSMTPIGTLQAAEDRRSMTPMVISGTHTLDICMWLLAGKKPVEVYARSVAKSFVSYGTKDATMGVFTFDDGTIWNMTVNWALPGLWPATVYSLEIGIVGTDGVLTIDDTHRDLVLASDKPHTTQRPGEKKNVSFLTSYPPGDIALGQLWGPMRDETNTWLARLYTGLETPHTTAQEGHQNLLLTMAMDLSAARGEAVKLPVTADDFER